MMMMIEAAAECAAMQDTVGRRSCAAGLELVTHGAILPTPWKTAINRNANNQAMRLAQPKAKVVIK